MKACELFHSFELNYFDFEMCFYQNVIWKPVTLPVTFFPKKIRKLHNPVKIFDTFPENLRELIWFEINVLYMIEHRNGKNVVGINLLQK